MRFACPGFDEDTKVKEISGFARVFAREFYEGAYGARFEDLDVVDVRCLEAVAIRIR